VRLAWNIIRWFLGLFIGNTSDLASVAAALDGAYGAWVNIDGFTVGEQREIYAGMRIFELAKQTKSLRHYVWSSLDYNLKVSANIQSTHLGATVLSVRGADRRL
jgi:NmrA-like family protein